MNLKINVKKRSKMKKSGLRQLRNDGFIPAVIYRHGKESKLISISQKEFMKEYRKAIGKIAIYELEVEGTEYDAIIKEKQIHPVERNFMHLDFIELLEDQPVTLKVPIDFVGEPIGVKEGGVLEILYRDVEISCLPKNIPDEISVDVSEMTIGDTKHISNLELKDVKINLPEDTAIVTVSLPEEEVETVEEEEELLEEGIEVEETEAAEEAEEEKPAEE